MRTISFFLKDCLSLNSNFATIFILFQYTYVYTVKLDQKKLRKLTLIIFTFLLKSFSLNIL